MASVELWLQRSRNCANVADADAAPAPPRSCGTDRVNSFKNDVFTSSKQHFCLKIQDTYASLSLYDSSGRRVTIRHDYNVRTFFGGTKSPDALPDMDIVHCSRTNITLTYYSGHNVDVIQRNDSPEIVITLTENKSD
ncbi:unnamed protein product [Pieris macdunnoughi]|uniref:Uncharacterized protein n=1 Tax=Pieris macdunnoughi TaxID=345717 RepID=A0A821TAR8_9NEOP|nr:unnamed protein product [Pieris macdunnoughi]